MSKSTRRPQQIYSIVMWALSLVFAGILMGLGSLIIKDLPRVDKTVTVEQFVDSDALKQIENRLETSERDARSLKRRAEDANNSYQSASADYQSARASLENWRAARTATEAADQNPQVISRTRAVEDLRDKEREALRVYEDAQEAQVAGNRAAADLRRSRTALLNKARPEFRKAQKAQEFKVFLYRLVLTLPLLVIAGWLAMKKRESAYWPLHRGFILFALFAFFVELVPYLPSYGGYVRYSVGLILVLIAGHFIIRAMRNYLARKQIEESRSESERRQSIEYETALKKIAAKTCPGCDRAIVAREDVETDFCVHCGIRLKEKCGSCGERNISFHRFCLCCGETTNSGLHIHADDRGAAAT